jgi:hypothetical protein
LTETTGRSNPARMAMMAMTTRSSINVKDAPYLRRAAFGLGRESTGHTNPVGRCGVKHSITMLRARPMRSADNRIFF